MTFPAPSQRRDVQRPAVIIEFALLMHTPGGNSADDLEQIKEFIAAVESAAPEGAIVQMREARWDK